MDREIRRDKDRYPGRYWLGVADGAHDQWAWLAERTDQPILDYWPAAGYLEKAAPGVCSRAEQGRGFDEGRVRLQEDSGGARALLKRMHQARDQRQPKVRVQATIWGKSFWQLREICGGGGFGSQNDLRAHFGLGDATNVTTLRIEWPSGIVQELTNLAANQILTITEPARWVPLGPREF